MVSSVYIDSLDGEMNSQSVKQEKQTLEEDYVRQRQNFMQHMVEADGKRQGIIRASTSHVACKTFRSFVKRS